MLPAPAVPLQNRIRFRVRDPAPRVSLILYAPREEPDFHDRFTAILQATSYPNIEPIVLARRMVQIPGAKVLPSRHPNAAAAWNEAAAATTGEVLVFLDATLSPDSADWLEELVGQACRGEVGAVGAKVVSADARMLHGGFALDSARIAVTLHFGVPASGSGYHGHLALQREVAAVSGACIAIRRAVFDQLIGFDSRVFPGAFHDVDLCLRARELKFRIVWTPFACLRSPLVLSEQAFVPAAGAAGRQMRARWAAQLVAEPFGNPNLMREGHGIAVPPRLS